MPNALSQWPEPERQTDGNHVAIPPCIVCCAVKNVNKLSTTIEVVSNNLQIKLRTCKCSQHNQNTYLLTYLLTYLIKSSSRVAFRCLLTLKTYKHMTVSARGWKIFCLFSCTCNFTFVWYNCYYCMQTEPLLRKLCDEMKWNCIDFRCVRKSTASRPSLTHYANKSSRRTE